MSEEKQVYFRAPQKLPYNLTEEQVLAAQRMWDLKAKQTIIQELCEESPLLEGWLEEDSSLLELLVSTIDKAMLKGAEMIANKMDILHDYMDAMKEQEKPVMNVLQYEFEPGKGICGVLRPNGEFIKCGNAEHYIVAEHIDFAEQTKCVYFSSLLRGSDGVCSLSPFGDPVMNATQVAWIKEHIEFLDEQQKWMFDVHKPEEDGQ